ncbi:hypothetical protein FSP39_007019 [Pinctada imbricata]|uniref:Protein tincar n=1 Tax=Pinctada imbricata TaxID=66713 RepID=A0AA88XZH8_PINIB|nr:hypothetical protein FSP39_007019 [Pinctada imbricata]
MVELKPKGTSFNSLWSVVYCFIAIGTQCYVSVQYISQYRTGLRVQDNKNSYPLELDVVLALTILSFVVFPLFIISSIFRIGNYANDGFKLGRDHAICPKNGHLIDRIENEILQRCWRHFCPISQTLHLLIAMCLLIPEVFLSSAAVQQGFKTPDLLWSSELNFLFDRHRPIYSDHVIRQQNMTALFTNSSMLNSSNQNGSMISVAFLNFVFALSCFSVRYAAVFWYTNKTLSLMIVIQMLFMSIDSIFTYSCAAILFKLAGNFHYYEQYVHLLLSPYQLLALYLTGGFVVFLSTAIVFEYGAHHFMEKFRLVDRKHNPDAYEKDTAIVRGPCNGYVTHTCAVITLVLIASFRGPIYFDVVSLYRLSNDNLLLSGLIVGVCYMVFWVLFWTILTVKQEWMFRILDYANVGQPIFVIKTDNLSKSKSISIGSIDMKDFSTAKRKRPSSVQSMDITPSESGFDEGEVMPSSEDERFEITLPPVSEIPNDNEDLFSSNGVIIRRNRNRRSAQRVTFHDPIRHSLGSLCDHNGSRCRSPFSLDNKLNVTADIHSMGRLGPKSQFFRRSSDPDMKQAMRRRQQNNIALATFKQNSLDARNTEYFANVNDLSTSSDDIRSNASEPLLTRRPERSRLPPSLENKRQNSVAEGDDKNINLKPSNIITAEQLDANKRTIDSVENEQIVNSGSELGTDITTKLNEKEYESFKGSKQPDIVPTENLNSNKIYPRPLIFIPKKQEGSRRDSANYSMTSSQDTSSNDSDPVRQVALCSNV